MKKLNEILENVSIIEIKGDTGIDISTVSNNSNNIIRHSLFVAIEGTRVDGHNYIGVAIEKGATAVICEKMPATYSKNITYIKVENSAEALALAVKSIYDNPSSKIKLIGVTGTNGKTSIATLLYKTFIKLGYKTGLLSTIKNYVHDKEIKATHTTPDIIKINELLCMMIDKGCEYCFMEVSSHAIHQKRICGLNFSGGIFTNITHDHLDYHKTFKEYIKVKKEFFDNLPKKAFALTNIDDKNGELMLQNCKASKYSYSLKSDSDFKCRVLESHFDGMLTIFNNVEVWINFIGKYNAYNLLAVYSTAVLLKQDEDEVLRIISELKPVDGRFEFVKSKNNITAIIDYAHTPDALSNVLQAITEINKQNKKIITVVGAGGNRDKTKRPEMGKIASKFSSKVILTSDNPRNENPETIISEMFAGIDEKDQKKILKITDRKEAIKTSYMLANEGDIILIAGKGHENYQEIKGEKHFFDDKEVIRQIFNEN